MLWCVIGNQGLDARAASAVQARRGAAARGPAQPGRSTPMKRKSTLAEGDRALERNGRRGTRTPEGVRQQIYSLPSLPLEYPPNLIVARTSELPRVASPPGSEL